LTAQRDDLTIRPITGPDELDLFNQLPYQLNEELAADLRDGHPPFTGSAGSPKSTSST